MQIIFTFYFVWKSYQH